MPDVDKGRAHAFPVLAAIRQYAGTGLDIDFLGGSLAALLRRFSDVEPRLARLHAATLEQQRLPAPDERLEDGPLWVEWCGVGTLLAERLEAACAAFFWPADGAFHGALAATMVGLAQGKPFAFPGAVLVERAAYCGGDSLADQMRASYGLPTAREATPEALRDGFNRHTVLLEGEYLLAGAGAPLDWIAYNARRPLLPESNLEALRSAFLATAVLRREDDPLLRHAQQETRHTAERMVDHLAEYGPAAALRLLRAAAAGGTLH